MRKWSEVRIRRLESFYTFENFVNLIIKLFCLFMYIINICINSVENLFTVNSKGMLSLLKLRAKEGEVSDILRNILRSIQLCSS